ncbi:MAG: DNA double-strand break repair nuclease NurA, partial [Candidatus Hydrothermia bacterium]
YLDEDEFYKWKLPQPFEHLKKKQIFFFYTRFEENHRVYKVEFIKDKEQEEILKIIYPTIVRGYPVILKIAHNDALITDSDAQIFEQHIRNELKGQIGIKLREELL